MGAPTSAQVQLAGQLVGGGGAELVTLSAFAWTVLATLAVAELTDTPSRIVPLRPGIASVAPMTGAQLVPSGDVKAENVLPERVICKYAGGTPAVVVRIVVGTPLVVRSTTSMPRLGVRNTP